MNRQTPQLYYVQFQHVVLGPYTAYEIDRQLYIGRFTSQCMVSANGELWEPMHRVPELMPEWLVRSFTWEPEHV